MRGQDEKEEDGSMMPDSVKKLELVPIEDASIPLLKGRGVEKVSCADQFWIRSDSMKSRISTWPCRARIFPSGNNCKSSLLEEILGEDGFDAVFLTGEELSPRKTILESILREAVDAEQFIESSF